MIIKDSTINVMVKDLDRSIAFYQALGLTIKNRWGNHYALISAPGLMIGLHPIEDRKTYTGSGNTSIGFIIENVEEAKDTLNSLLIKFEENMDQSSIILKFKDPDGTELYYMKSNWQNKN